MRLQRLAAGFTLVELLVAMLIGLLLVGGILHIVLSTQATYREAQRFATLQDKVRFTTDFMARDIRGASTVIFDPTTHELSVIRARQPPPAPAWCGVHGIANQETTVRYRMTDGALTCEGQEIVRDLDPDYTNPWIQIDPSGHFVTISLPLQSIGANGDLIDHLLQFQIALRNAILADYNSVPHSN